MDYTPRQLQAFLIIAQQRRQQDLSQTLIVGTLAARGEERAIRDQLKQWE
jgi:hypothetical protein